MRALALWLALFAAPASAQLLNPSPSIDTSSFAAKTDIPPPCATAPSGDTLNGSVGTAAACTPKQDNTRPTAVQAGNTTLAADCTFSITFTRSFTSSTPFVYAAAINSNGAQMPCTIATRSATGATGKCASAQATTLSLSIVTTGLTLTPFGTTCTAGTPVMFVGREPTQ